MSLFITLYLHVLKIQDAMLYFKWLFYFLLEFAFGKHLIRHGKYCHCVPQRLRFNIMPILLPQKRE